MTESQPASAPAAWRTVAITAFALVLETAAFIYGARRGFDAFSSAAFGSLVMAGTVKVASVAAKALGEHLGNGTGWKGMVSALMTDVKPADGTAPGAPQ